jgi:hypothetical protein
VRSDRVVVVAPLLDDDVVFLQAVEDFPVESFVAKLYCEIPASRHASGGDLRHRD